MDPSDDTTSPWLAPWFQHPGRTELASGHHLRPLRAADAGLPGLPEGVDLVAAAAATRARTAYVYGVFDDEERRVLGTVTLGPGDPSYDVVVTWAVPGCASLEAALVGQLPAWVDRDWPFTRPLIVRG